MVQHRDIAAAEIHRLVNWEFANATARNSESVATEDIHKLAFEVSTGTYHMLLNTAPTWVQLLTEGDEAVPGGLAGGDLSGTYPNPEVIADSHTHTPGNSIPAYPTTLPPSGPALGDLTGTYPNPSLTSTGVTPGQYNRATVTVDSKGRITAITANATPTLGGQPFPGFNNVTLTGIAQATTPAYNDNSNRIATTKYVTVGQIRAEELPTGETMTIPTGTQKVVEERFKISGTVSVYGRLVIGGTPNNEFTANFHPENAQPLLIPKDYFKIVLSGYKISSPVYIYGTLKVI